MPSRRMTLLTAVAALALPGVAAADADAEHPEHVPASQMGEDLQEYVEGASRLEGRIIAPCCWNQTIDIHGSEPSYQLRREIRRRLKAGESPEAIEASFVKRYGPKILAVPDTSPLGSLATVLAVGFGAAGVGAYFMLRRWSRVGKGEKAKLPVDEHGDEVQLGSAKDDALDKRLDRELSEIGDQA